MKAASVNEIKKELSDKDARELRELCMRLAKFKKDNKELLSYLLFEALDESGYVSNIKSELDELFNALPDKNVYFIKKGLRKILRILNKQIKYSLTPQTEVELRIYFCSRIIQKEIPLHASQVLNNLYLQQLKKIDSALHKLPEDLQFDYATEIEQLRHTNLLKGK